MYNSRDYNHSDFMLCDDDDETPIKPRHRGTQESGVGAAAGSSRKRGRLSYTTPRPAARRFRSLTAQTPRSPRSASSAASPMAERQTVTETTISASMSPEEVFDHVLKVASPAVLSGLAGPCSRTSRRPSWYVWVRFVACAVYFVLSCYE